MRQILSSPIPPHVIPSSSLRSKKVIVIIIVVVIIAMIQLLVWPRRPRDWLHVVQSVLDKHGIPNVDPVKLKGDDKSR